MLVSEPAGEGQEREREVERTRKRIWLRPIWRHKEADTKENHKVCGHMHMMREGRGESKRGEAREKAGEGKECGGGGGLFCLHCF